METLGAKIRTLRKQYKLTQQDLADGIVTPSMISQIESDRAIPSAVLLQHIAKRLSVPIQVFQSDVVDKTDEILIYRSARNLIESHRYEEALEQLRTLSWPLSPQFKPEVVYSEMANCNVHLNRLDEAWKLYEAVVEVGYEKNDIATAVHGYHNVATTLKRLGRNKIARMYWQRATDLLHQHQDMYMPIAIKIAFHLGRMYLEEENWVQARNAYEEAVALSNRYGGSLDFAKTYHGLACACAQMGDHDEALAYNDRAIAAHVSADNQLGTLRCRFNRGVILRAATRYHDAQAHFMELRAIFSDKEPLLQALLHEMSLLAWFLGDFQLALSESSTALQKHNLPASYVRELRLIRARIYLNEEQYELALSEAKLGLNSDAVQGMASGFELQQIIRECQLALGEVSDALAQCVEEAHKQFRMANQTTATISA